MVKRSILLICCLLACALVQAQQTLNIHTTTQGTVSIAFAQKPVITLSSPTVLKVASEQLTVEFPFAEVERITFEDAPDAVPALVERDGAATLHIYDLSGRLVQQVPAREGAASLDLSKLRPGVYVVKDGKRTYKVSVK
ncbi:MAG: T9SS type A sorting domain-containing protein [Bacteroidaceae bacterium]|nr:T9SS type A sorting domain-containing protein [Bacteroidaceae bacterium]